MLIDPLQAMPLVADPQEKPVDTLRDPVSPRVEGRWLLAMNQMCTAGGQP
ncbi:hypothetical protein [Pseudomonas phoenicis]